VKLKPVLGVALLAALLALSTACSGTPAHSTAATPGTGSSATPRITITPGDGAASVRPDQHIVVTSDHGTLTKVTVRSKDSTVDGELSADRTTWRGKWTLTPGAAYTVSATAAASGGKTTTVAGRFQAAKTRSGLAITSIVPDRAETVGIGMPIIITFDRTVTDQAAVERSLEVRSTHRHEGSWRWTTVYGVQQAIFRLNGYWRAHEKVTVTAHLAGVKTGAGTYGAADVTHRFTIGDAHTVTVNAKTHRLVAKNNGKTVRTWGVSLGTGGDVRSDGVDHLLTTSGIHLTMEEGNPVRMTPPGLKPTDHGWYSEDVRWARRISNSGEYIHQTGGQEYCLGHSNCSHGCVRSPADAAKWFYGWSYRGDIVTITGTARRLDWSNGWGFYQMPWKKWVKGSALDRPASTG
jgi:lipoprotein-anchoring transpeptidase ErfK/SrfK